MAGGRAAGVLSRFRRLSPATLPGLLAAAYLVLLVTRFPRLIRWENGDSDIASAYTMADSVARAHTGTVHLGTQGNWVPLVYGLLTRSLGFQRVLWEISPALLLLVAALVVAWSISRVAGRAASVVSAAIILSASPVALVTFTSADMHNTTVPGTALLGAYLVWLTARPRSRRAVAAAVAAMSLVIGSFLASDELLAIVGVLPFAIAGLVMTVARRPRADPFPILGVLAGAAALAVLVSAIGNALGFRTSTPPLAPSTHPGTQLVWLAQGLLRLGNGRLVVPQPALTRPLTIAAALATVAGIGTSLRLGYRVLARPAPRAPDRARGAHCLFWATSLVCAGLAYVLTNAPAGPSDRYLIVAVPAVAAAAGVVRGRWPARLAALGATAFIAAGLASLALDAERSAVNRGSAVPAAAAIERAVAGLHVQRGYAGYWNAAALEWSTAGRLTVHPLSADHGYATAASYAPRVDGWYRPRPRTASYLLLVSGDPTLPDRLPSGLPRPAHELHLGAVTLAVWPFDIARYLRPPLDP